MSQFLLLLLIQSGVSLKEDSFSAVSEVKLLVRNIKSEEGLIRVAVYNKPEHFNQEPLYTFAFSKEDLSNGEMTCRFQLPPGGYAFSLLDDQNGNKKMDYNFVGIPKEGFGFSNDAKIKFLKAPNYESCSVLVDSQEHEWRVKMRYL